MASALGPPAPDRAAAPSAAAAEYRVSRGDVLEVTVFQVPNLSRTMEVDGSGYITMPLVGGIPAAGKTVRDLEGEVTRRLGARYLQNPQVTIFLKDAVGQRLTVDGAVRKPGVLQSRGQTSLLQVIAEAQGFTDTADQSNVIIIRTTAQGRVAARFDANAIRSGQVADPAVFGGDTVVVDESGTKTAWKHVREIVPVAGVFRPF